VADDIYPTTYQGHRVVVVGPDAAGLVFVALKRADGMAAQNMTTDEAWNDEATREFILADLVAALAARRG
jgi:hypothetical protein